MFFRRRMLTIFVLFFFAATVRAEQNTSTPALSLETLNLALCAPVSTQPAFCSAPSVHCEGSTEDARPGITEGSISAINAAMQLQALGNSSTTVIAACQNIPRPPYEEPSEIQRQFNSLFEVMPLLFPSERPARSVPSAILNSFQSLTGFPLCSPTQFAQTIPGTLVQTVNQKGDSGLRGLELRDAFLDSLSDFMATQNGNSKEAILGAIRNLKNIISRQRDFINISRDCIAAMNEAEAAAAAQSSYAYPTSCMKEKVRGCFGTELSDLDSNTLIAAIFLGPNHVPFQPTDTVQSVSERGLAVIRQCQESVSANRVVSCVTDRLGYTNSEENLRLSREVGTVILGFDQDSVNDLRDVFLRPAFQRIFQARSGDGPLGTAMGFIYRAHEGSMLYDNTSHLISGAPRAIRQMWEGQFVSACSRPPMVQTIPEESIERAGLIALERMLIHEYAHSIDHRHEINFGSRGVLNTKLGARWRLGSWQGSGDSCHVSSAPANCSFLAAEVQQPVDACNAQRMPDFGGNDMALASGFVSAYATSAPSEDFAETFANYMTGYDRLPRGENGRRLMRQKFEFIRQVTGVERFSGLENP